MTILITFLLSILAFICLLLLGIVIILFLSLLIIETAKTIKKEVNNAKN
jgi:hypothetical protein